MRLPRYRLFLLPSIDEWLPEKHLARFVVEVMDGLDLSGMTKRLVGGRPQLQQAHLARQLQHPHNQPFDLLQKSPPNRRDRVVVGMPVRRDELERHRVIGRTFQLPARKHPPSYSRTPAAQQQRRMVRCRLGARVRWLESRR